MKRDILTSLKSMFKIIGVDIDWRFLNIVEL